MFFWEWLAGRKPLFFSEKASFGEGRLKPGLLAAAGEEHAGEADAGEDERRRLWDGLECEVDVAAEPANSAEHPHASRMT
jgi:hypothetical protein